MKPWNARLASIGLAGSCLFWTGCGGGDVPDTSAASDSSGGGGGAPAAVASNDAPAAAAQPGAEAAAAQAPPAVDASAAPVVAAEAKSEALSATTEMLALANASAPAGGEKDKAEGAEAAPAQDQAQLGGASGYPGGSGGGIPGGYPGGPGGSAAAASGATPGGPGGMRAGFPGAAAGAGMPAGYSDAMAGGAPGGSGAANRGGGGMPGFGGPGGGAGGSADAPDFREPYVAVRSFLAAVTAKNPERLTEAVALHAPTEASERYKKVFEAILEGSLAPEDLDQIAKKFEGMTISGQNQAKSSGKLGIIVSKSGTNGDTLTRTVTVRKEKSGWKVVDISGEGTFERPIMIQGTRRGTSGRGRGR